MPSRIAAPSALSGCPVIRATKSGGGKPARSSAADVEPAEVPTMVGAMRASQPSSSASAAITPAWNAVPARPPLPRTSPTRLVMAPV